jgi:haloacetate dehalogenase
MFEQFTRENIKTSGATVHYVRGGRGYPILLLHGYPETHVCWHLIVPKLAKHFTVICTDLRGFGDSSKPPSDPKHLGYSKRVMAQDQVEVMEHLGFTEFAVIGHDRGARVAHRMALDHPDKVTKLALLDIIPTLTAFENVDKDMATGAFNWFFSIQPDGLPERLIAAEPIFYLHWILNHWRELALSPEAIAEYERCFDDEMIRATNEEFRSAASIDLEHDSADKGRKIACPTLVLWSHSSWAAFDVMEVWKQCADNVQGSVLDCGHFLPEEAPDETARHLINFLE